MLKNNVTVTFEKMHGAGNDFIVIDARDAQFPKKEIEKQASRLCHRKTGIGADGILMLGNSESTDYTMYYLNADGSDAGMCGNGARCLARFAVQLGFPEHLSFQMNDRVYQAAVHSGTVSITFPVNPDPIIRNINGMDWYDLNTGTEHVVSIDDGNASIPDEEKRSSGREIRNRSDLFPSGTNVNFAHVIDNNRLKLVTYERGVEDLTLACGTGAIATAVTWEHIKYSKSGSGSPGPSQHQIEVDCPGGLLEVTFATVPQQNKLRYHDITLHGPAVSVFKGSFVLQ